MVAAVMHLFDEIWTFRSHVWIVFNEQFRAAYHGSGLGLLWNYLLPVVPLSVYLFLSRLRVFPDFEGVDSAAFLTFGVTLWFLFSGIVQTPISIIQSRNKESMKTAFPLSASIASGFAKLLFDTLVRIIFVAIVIFVTQSWPMWQCLLLPLILIPALFFFASAGLLLGTLNVIYNDVSRVVNIVLQYGIFISGVIFPLPDSGLFATLNLFNPFAIFIDASRSIVFQGIIQNTELYLVMTAVSVLMLIISCRIFFIMEYRVRGIN